MFRYLFCLSICEANHFFYFQNYSKEVKENLINAAFIFLKKPEYAKFTTDLPTVSRRILLAGPSGIYYFFLFKHTITPSFLGIIVGTELFQEQLARALAKHMQASLLIFDGNKPEITELVMREVAAELEKDKKVEEAKEGEDKEKGKEKVESENSVKPAASLFDSVLGLELDLGKGKEKAVQENGTVEEKGKETEKEKGEKDSEKEKEKEKEKGSDTEKEKHDGTEGLFHDLAGVMKVAFRSISEDSMDVDISPDAIDAEGDEENEDGEDDNEDDEDEEDDVDSDDAWNPPTFKKGVLKFS